MYDIAKIAQTVAGSQTCQVTTSESSSKATTDCIKYFKQHTVPMRKVALNTSHCSCAHEWAC